MSRKHEPESLNHGISLRFSSAGKTLLLQKEGAYLNAWEALSRRDGTLPVTDARQLLDPSATLQPELLCLRRAGSHVGHTSASSLACANSCGSVIENRAWQHPVALIVLVLPGDDRIKPSQKVERVETHPLTIF